MYISTLAAGSAIVLTAVLVGACGGGADGGSTATAATAVAPAAAAGASPTSQSAPVPAGAAASAIVEYPVPNVAAGLANVSDGNLWGIGSVWSDFSKTWTNSAVRISPSGTVASTAITGPLATTSTALAMPLAAPDGALWLDYAGAVYGVALQSPPATGAASAAAAPSVTAGESTTLFTLAGPPELFDGSGALWFTAVSGNAGVGVDDLIGSVTQSGAAVVSTSFDTQPNGVSAMALGRDGSVWFTSAPGNQVGFVTAAGNVTTFALPSHPDDVDAAGSPTGSQPSGIALGADGNMWFVERAQPTQRIGVVTPAGVINEYTVTGDSGYVLGGNIAPGPDGNLWFTIWPDEIGSISTLGVVKIYQAPTANAWPSSMTVGPDGRMWFTEPANLAAAGKVGAVTVAVPAVGNDDFANARVLPGAAGFVFTNDYSATAEASDPVTANVTPTRTLWFQWTAPATCTATCTLQVGTFGSSYETVVGVYTGSQLTALTGVAAAHMGGPGLTGVSAAVTPGVTYDIVVDGNDGAKGVLLLDYRLQ